MGIALIVGRVSDGVHLIVRMVSEKDKSVPNAPNHFLLFTTIFGVSKKLIYHLLYVRII